MKTFEELNHTNSTIIDVEHARLYSRHPEKGTVELRTTTDPVISDDGETYSAPAVDVFDNAYVITWVVIDPEITDESEICDWKNPSSITAK